MDFGAVGLAKAMVFHRSITQGGENVLLLLGKIKRFGLFSSLIHGQVQKRK